MGIMTRMRDNAHVFIIAFAVVFILFWVISDVDVGSALRGSANEVGEINGKKIKYQEFTSVVERVVEQQKKKNDGKDLDENAIASIREQVWNDYVTQAVIDVAIKELGISVSDQEIIDWVRSENPPDILTQQLKDSTGKLNKENYRRFLANPGPENEQALVQIEQQLRSDLFRQKLTSALTASVQVSDGELKEQFKQQNQQFTVKYIAFDPNRFAPNDTTQPTETEFQDYYNTHKAEYKTDELRRLQFVSFLDVPTAEDTTAVMNELQAVVKEAREGKDFMQLIKDNSELPYKDTWTNISQLPMELSSIASQPVGSIIGPMHDQGGVSLIKLLETREGKESYLKASHILIRSTDPGMDAQVKEKAQSIMNRIRQGENFAALAQQFSDDKGSAVRGGDLGWFGKGRMVKPFEEAAFGAKKGELVGPVKTDYGYHIIRVDDKSNQELKYAVIKLSVKPSSRTRDNAYDKARNFAYFASDHGFEKEAQLNKYEIRETGEFMKQRGSYIPEIGVNPSLLKITFEGKVGDVTDVYKSSNGYVVARIAEIIPAGYRSLDKIKPQIVEQVKMERRLHKTIEVAKTYYAKLQPGKGIESIIPPDSSLKLTTQGPFNMQQGLPGMGRDMKMLGHIAALRDGEISKPFNGMRAVYIVQLISKTPFDETKFQVQRDELRKQALPQKQNEFIQAWLEKMKEKIKIVDNRDKFFR